MKKNSAFRLLVISILLIGAGWLTLQPAAANNILRYSSSAQVREALGPEGLNALDRKSVV